jgi:8-oxo-dGTP pyrophosphatase MutT (NUDIX family)
MTHTTRYQGAIVRDHQLLLIMHTEHASGRSYWVIPGGRIEPGESEEACVAREMLEETCLQVQVERLLLDEPSPLDAVYQRRKTYLCRIVGGEAAPGYEPEADASEKYAITEVGWVDLRRPQSWTELLVRDPITYPMLQQVRAALGYVAAENSPR